MGIAVCCGLLGWKRLLLGSTRVMPESCWKSNPCSSAGDSAPASLVVSLLNATLLHLLLLLVIMMEAIECMVGCHFAD